MALCALSLVALGCGGDHEASGRAQDARGGDSDRTANVDAGGAAAGPDGGDASAGSESVECGLAGCGRTVQVDQGRVDMLFVVDNSISMQEEQAALAAEFPRMLRKLTSGDHDEDGTPEAVPVTDLHLGVVSSDLGVALPDSYACTPDGDAGRLQNTPRGSDCPPAPDAAFLQYRAGETEPDMLARQFGCIAALGTAGCGYEQPLESALKALWPSSDPSLRFLSLETIESYGQGDRHNRGFLRNDPERAPATLAIVIVSDEDDCSVYGNDIFQPRGGAFDEEPVNLRCFFHPERLQPIERYLQGYRALHGPSGARVLFAAIVGVPVDLVDQAAIAAVDWNDPAQRAAHNQRILDDPRMQERVLEGSELSGGELTPSCESELGRATPPRRIVELAKRFDADALVQSICGDNLGPPIDQVVRVLLDGPD